MSAVSPYDTSRARRTANQPTASPATTGTPATAQVSGVPAPSGGTAASSGKRRQHGRAGEAERGGRRAGAEGEAGAEGVGRAPDHRVGDQREREQQDREPARPHLGQRQERVLGRRAVPHQRRADAAARRRRASAERPRPRAARSASAYRGARRALRTPPGSQDGSGPSGRPPYAVHTPRGRGHHGDQRDVPGRAQSGRPQRAARRVQRRRAAADGEVSAEHAPRQRARRPAEHLLVPLGRRPAHAARRAARAAAGSARRSSGVTPTGAGAPDSVSYRTSSVAVGEQPQRGGDVQRAAGAAVGVRRADPQHHDEHGERSRARARPRRRRPPTQAAAGRRTAGARRLAGPCGNGVRVRSLGSRPPCSQRHALGRRNRRMSVVSLNIRLCTFSPKGCRVAGSLA